MWSLPTFCRAMASPSSSPRRSNVSTTSSTSLRASRSSSSGAVCRRRTMSSSRARASVGASCAAEAASITSTSISSARSSSPIWISAEASIARTAGRSGSRGDKRAPARVSNPAAARMSPRSNARRPLRTSRLAARLASSRAWSSSGPSGPRETLRLFQVVPEISSSSTTRLPHLEPIAEALVQLGSGLLRQGVVRRVTDQLVPEPERVLAGTSVRSGRMSSPDQPHQAPLPARRFRGHRLRPAAMEDLALDAARSITARSSGRAGRAAPRAAPGSSRAPRCPRAARLATSATSPHEQRVAVGCRGSGSRSPHRCRRRPGARRSSRAPSASSGSSRTVVALSLPPPQPGRSSRSSGRARQRTKIGASRPRSAMCSTRSRKWARPSGCRRRRTASGLSRATASRSGGRPAISRASRNTRWGERRRSARRDARSVDLLGRIESRSCLSTSTTGQNVMPSPYGRQRPGGPGHSDRAGTLATSRDLPTPGGPRIDEQLTRAVGDRGLSNVLAEAERAPAPGRPWASPNARDSTATPAVTSTSRNAASGSRLALDLERQDRLRRPTASPDEAESLLADENGARALAACSSRAATFTASPVTSVSDPSPATTSPVLTPIRAASETRRGRAPAPCSNKP